MHLQYLFNSNGERSGVFIPMDLWEKLKLRNKELEIIEDEDKMKELLASFKQVKLMQEGKLPKQSVKDFLNEL